MLTGADSELSMNRSGEGIAPIPIVRKGLQTLISAPGDRIVLTIQDRPFRVCDGLTRREWLHIGALGMFGLSMPALLQARAEKSTVAGTFGRAKSCIVLWLYGGPSQH